MAVTLGKHQNTPFNTTVETGLRALVVLEAMYPRKCDLDELTWFDYLVVHTSDMGGPESLHPDLNASVGEMLVRRRLVEESLVLLLKLHLVVANYDESGVSYQPSEEAPTIIELMSSSYNTKLKERAKWIAEEFSQLTTDAIADVFSDRIGRWTAEFRMSDQPSNSQL